MKTILFCQNTYAFGILNPIKEVLVENDFSFIWFLTEKIVDDFPFKSDKHTTNINELKRFESDAIFVPGNEVPHYLRGLKVQIFHGLAGEKGGHFKIRHYFDLYLTQGPYFTRGFNKLKAKYKDFDVIETGWPKLDIYGENLTVYENEKKELLKTHNAKSVLLYAPTFSPSLTSAPYLTEEIEKLSKYSNYLILIKFHPLMDKKWIETYTQLANKNPNIIFQDEKNVIKFLLIADLLISDTSSVIYEFLLLNKPVITFKNISKEINWEDSKNYSNLEILVKSNLEKDPFKKFRQKIFNEFHPYKDGMSAKRMVDAVQNYIKEKGVPTKRKLSFFRRYKINSKFGR